MIRGDREQRGLEISSQLGQIFHFAVENNPADSRRRGRSGNLRHGSATDRFEDNAAGARLWTGLDSFEELLTLQNGIVLRIKEFEIDAQARRRCLRRVGLLLLIVVVASGERDDEFLHEELLMPAVLSLVILTFSGR